MTAVPVYSGFGSARGSIIYSPDGKVVQITERLNLENEADKKLFEEAISRIRGSGYFHAASSSGAKSK